MSEDRRPIPLTYQHWAGVSPYTSPFGFARTCVFDKQSTSKRLLQPTIKWASHLPKLREACLPSSLRILLPIALVFSTCPPVSVYGTAWFESHCEPFLASWIIWNRPNLLVLCIIARLTVKTDFPISTTLQFTLVIFVDELQDSCSVNPQLKRFTPSSRILTACPSTTPLQPRLRSRLTRRGRTLRRKPWAFGGCDSHTSSALLIPAFSLPCAPPNFTVELHRPWNAPLPRVSCDTHL